MPLAILESHMQKNERGHLYTSFTKMDSNLMKDLNVSQETIRILRRTQAAPFLPQLQPLLDVSPEARENKGK